MRPLCYPEGSLAARAPHTAAASGSPAPAPCMQLHGATLITAQALLVLTRKDGVATSKLSEDFSKPVHTDPSRKYSGHTVPNPQAHAVSHSVAQGDQRQFSNWPSNASFSLQQSRFSNTPELNLQ